MITDRVWDILPWLRYMIARVGSMCNTCSTSPSVREAVCLDCLGNALAGRAGGPSAGTLFRCICGASGSPARELPLRTCMEEW